MTPYRFWLAALVVLVPTAALATPINFVPTGNANVSGFVQFDDADFDGTNFQFLLNTKILDLSIIAFGQTFGLSDVATTDSTIIDSSGLVPRIVNGAGNLADNGVLAIAFFPDGFGGTALDGDASLSTGPSGGGLAQTNFYAVQWVPTAVGAQVPEPTSLLLLGTGGLGLVATLRRRRKQNPTNV